MTNNNNSSNNFNPEVFDLKPNRNYKPKRNTIAIILIVLLIVGIAFGVATFLYYSIKDKSNSFGQGISKTEKNKNQNLSDQSNTPIQFAQPQNAKTTVEVVNSNLDSVISINLISKSEGKTAAGTGYIVSTDGLVITNKHVISLACRSGASPLAIKGFANDNKEYNLELKSIDPIDDIAILKITDKSTGFKSIEFGDSTKLQLGEDVIAVGNALGNLQNTVTKGVISGLDRSIDSLELRDECTNGEFRVDNLIQTDAAINKGNSGGPLFNATGQVIGMNTLGTSDAQNVGLAIPSSTILSSLNSYLAGNSIVRPRLGVISQQINPLKKVQTSWLPVDYGEFIGSLDVSIDPTKVVSQGSSAQEAGLKFGDIVLEINGQKVISTKQNPNPLRRNILTKKVGETIDISYLKAKSVNSNGSVEYESTPVKTKIKLKGVGYNLKEAKMFMAG
jgi:serine protease Do